MNTVQDMIDCLGIPPAELCLDWAWQLQAYQDARASCPAQDPASSASDAIAWSRISINQSGQLQLGEASTTVENASYELAPLIDQLFQWAALAAPTQTAGVILQDAPPRGTQLTNQERLRQQTLSLTRAAISSQPREKSPADGSLKTMVSAATRPTKRLQFHRAYAIAIVVLAVALLLLGYSLFPREETIATAERTTLQSTRRERVEPAPLSLAAEQSVASEVLSLSELSLAETPLSPAPLADIEEFDFDSPLESMHNSSEWTDAATELTNALPLGTNPVQDSAAQTESAPSTGNYDLNRQPSDLVADIAEMTKRAEIQTAESAVAGDYLPGEQPPEPALMIATTPALQLQRFDKSLRPRQPSWNVRITVSDGFAISPSGSQTITGREFVSWRLSDDANKNSDAKTLVLVQVQLAGNRDASLRWRVVAGAEDLAGVAIPLDRRLLDQIQGLLGTRMRMIQTEVERLRTLGSIAGLPSETRSALLHQRRLMEHQLKLAARLLEVVADANQFEGWLDGQIQVHAELLDIATNPPTSMITFGAPNAAPATK